MNNISETRTAPTLKLNYISRVTFTLKEDLEKLKKKIPDLIVDGLKRFEEDTGPEKSKPETSSSRRPVTRIDEKNITTELTAIENALDEILLSIRISESILPFKIFIGVNDLLDSRNDVSDARYIGNRMITYTPRGS